MLAFMSSAASRQAWGRRLYAGRSDMNAALPTARGGNGAEIAGWTAKSAGRPVGPVS
jgi:hypothetical protein